MKTLNNSILCLLLLASASNATAEKKTIFASSCTVDNLGKWEYFYTKPTDSESLCLVNRVDFTSASPEHSDYTVDYTYDSKGRKTSVIKSSKSDGILLNRSFSYDGDNISLTETEYSGGKKSAVWRTEYLCSSNGRIQKIFKYSVEGTSEQLVETIEYEYAPTLAWHTETVTSNPDSDSPEVMTLKYVKLANNVLREMKFNGKSTDLQNLLSIKTLPTLAGDMVGNIDMTTGNLSKITGMTSLKSDGEEGVSFEYAVLPECFFPTEDFFMSEKEQAEVTARAFHPGDKPSVLQSMTFFDMDNNPPLLWDDMELIAPFVLQYYRNIDDYSARLSAVYKQIGHMELTYIGYMPAVSVGRTYLDGLQPFAAVCADGLLSMTGLEDGDAVRITDLSGCTVASFVFDGTPADMSALDKGIYIATSGGRSAKFTR